MVVREAPGPRHRAEKGRKASKEGRGNMAHVGSSLTRRGFLTGAAATAAGGLLAGGMLAGCAPQEKAPADQKGAAGRIRGGPVRRGPAGPVEAQSAKRRLPGKHHRSRHLVLGRQDRLARTVEPHGEIGCGLRHPGQRRRDRRLLPQLRAGRDRLGVDGGLRRQIRAFPQHARPVHGQGPLRAHRRRHPRRGRLRGAIRYPAWALRSAARRRTRRGSSPRPWREI